MCHVCVCVIYSTYIYILYFILYTLIETLYVHLIVSEGILNEGDVIYYRFW